MCPGVEKIRLSHLSLASSIRDSYGFGNSAVFEIFGRIQPENAVLVYGKQLDAYYGRMPFRRKHSRVRRDMARR
ncbi:hypothetical protein SBDP1_620007 [Syntrophobacter sp. SbD1]|nr:hypothetical protein SBDP1_620007 [Syntrophobacter sp. SbD1]